MLKNDPAGFFAPVSLSKFLTGFSLPHKDAALMEPCFDDSSPVLYPRKDAVFIVHELRRVGYNVHAVPWLLLAIVERIKARKKNPWKK